MRYKAHNQHQHALNTTLEAIGGTVVAFRASWARRLGSIHAALVLQQLIYEGHVHANDEGWFFITADDMEDTTAVGRDAYRQARNTLTDLGIIETKRKGIPAKTFIRFNHTALSQWLSPQQDCDHPQSVLRPSADSDAETRNVITRDQQELNTNTPDSTTPAWEQRFNRWYSTYPRKQAKGDARKAWQKINPDDGLVAEMVAAVERQKRTHDWQKDGGKYIPLPASWLRAERWLDEVGDVAPSTPQRQPQQTEADPYWGQMLAGLEGEE